MTSISSFFKLIRWSNLVFIALIQWIFYFVFFKNSNFNEHGLSPQLLNLLILSSVLIAAAGYVINDYFDIQIDKINKPEKVIIGDSIQKKHAFIIFILLAAGGIILSGYLAIALDSYLLLILNLVSLALLILYSIRYKKAFLTGNIIVSLLSAWVLFIFPVAVMNQLISESPGWETIMVFSVVYGGFAFLTTLIREIVKDMEDREGDAQYGSKTLPITLGMGASKTIVKLLFYLLAGIIITLLVYFVFQQNKWPILIYGVFFLILPIFFAVQKLKKAAVSAQYHFISYILKGIMLFGILSMLFLN